MSYQLLSVNGLSMNRTLFVPTTFGGRSFSTRITENLRRAEEVTKAISERITSDSLKSSAGLSFLRKSEFIADKINAKYSEFFGGELQSFEIITELAQYNSMIQHDYQQFEVEWIRLNEMPAFMASDLSNEEMRAVKEAFKVYNDELAVKSKEEELASQEFDAKRSKIEKKFKENVAKVIDSKATFVSNYPRDALPIEWSLKFVKRETTKGMEDMKMKAQYDAIKIKLQEKPDVYLTHEELSIKDKFEVEYAERIKNRKLDRRKFLNELLYEFKSELWTWCRANPEKSVLDHLRDAYGINKASFVVKETAAV